MTSRVAPHKLGRDILDHFACTNGLARQLGGAENWHHTTAITGRPASSAILGSFP
ncbi:hypothetical protein L915_16230 [Phytophthora nicotianae]|uniref:Uncharacterized protein n=1 Tax=Phytophthora nicotianae TaxID=4792 RepID=W2G5R1_PHYNI|nr:hypothetical protein L915_16230 [Phytophthora nicotianae]ETL30969.1 hypothetical protein L916_16125 [Phytophthora nicotianae]